MVELVVDKNNREDLKKLHTATHILNYSCKKILGNHVWQNGSNLKRDSGTLDITHYQNIEESQLKEIENLANEIVFSNSQIKIENLNRNLAEKKYGFSIYQGGAIPQKTLRIVKVGENYDIEACGGLHIKNTNEIGIIKIISSQKLSDGVVRLKYCVSYYALNYIQKNEEILNKVKEFLNVSQNKIFDSVVKFFDMAKTQKNKIEKFEKILISEISQKIIELNIKEQKLSDEFDMKILNSIFENILSKKRDIKIYNSNFILSTKKIINEDFKKEISKNNYFIYIK